MRRVALIAGLLAVLLFAADAQAAKRVGYISASHRTEDGIKLKLRADAERGHDRVTVRVERELLGSEYDPLGGGDKTSGLHVRSSIGDLGEINMRFERRGKARTRKGGRCEDLVIQRGVLLGKFRFETPNGTIDVVERKLSAERVLFRIRPCPLRGDRDPPVFVACSGPAFLTVVRARGERPVYFDASAQRRSGGTRVNHYAAYLGSADQFVVAPDRSTATVTPAEVFRGTGTYADKAFRGDLEMATIDGRWIPLTPAIGTFVRASGGVFGCGVPKDPEPDLRR